MSYDFVKVAPAGIRNDKAIKYENARARLDGTNTGKYEVRFNHSDNLLIDELFVFETLEDAEWFVKEGCREMLYVGESAPDYLSDIRAHNNRPTCSVPF